MSDIRLETNITRSIINELLEFPVLVSFNEDFIAEDEQVVVDIIFRYV